MDNAVPRAFTELEVRESLRKTSSGEGIFVLWSLSIISSISVILMLELVHPTKGPYTFHTQIEKMLFLTAGVLNTL